MSHRSTNEWYVAKNGSDSNNGGPTSPFLTVQAAINAAQTYILTAGSPGWTDSYITQSIYIAPGFYPENLTITTGFIRLAAYAGSGLESASLTSTTTVKPGYGLGVVIAGFTSASPALNLNITNVLASANVNNRKVELDGIALQTASLVTNTAPLQVASTTSQPFTLIATNCTFCASGRVAYLAPGSAANTSVFNFSQCNFQQNVGASAFTTPALEIASGSLNMQLCNASINQNTPVLLVSGTATLQQCRLCNFYANTSASAAAPLLRISSTFSYATPISSCVFAYTSAPSTPRPSTSCAIEFTGSTAQSGVFINNLFLLLGTTADGLAIRTDTPSAAHLVYAANNFTLLGQARSSNVSLQAMTPIGNL